MSSLGSKDIIADPEKGNMFLTLARDNDEYDIDMYRDFLDP